MPILIDTDVLAPVLAGRAPPAVAAWYAALPASERRVSAITLGELARNAALLAERDAAASARLFLAIEEIGADRTHAILPFDAACAETWAALTRRAEAAGQPLDRRALDLMVAATALVHGLTIATHHMSDFTGLGARLFDPGRAPAPVADPVTVPAPPVAPMLPEAAPPDAPAEAPAGA